MNKEYEVKVTSISITDIDYKLLALGAKKQETVLLRRWVFDILSENGKFLRLRDNGDCVTLTYKNKGSGVIGETEELEVIVDDFQKTFEILSKVPGFARKLYQENKRTKYTFNDIEFCIDEWPLIEPYLEIESYSEEKVHEGLHLLGISEHAGDIDVKELYAQKGIALNDIAELKF